jgi:hypothetical protein
MTLASQLGEWERAGDFAFRIKPGGVLELFRRPADDDATVDVVRSGGGAVPTNAWSHVTAVYGPGADGEAPLRLYVDGVLVGDGAISDVYSSSRGDQYFRVGASELSPEIGVNRYHLFGDLDELMTFDRALTSDEVLVHHDRFADLIGE